MKKILLIAFSVYLMCMGSLASAYTIGGAYAQLISCDWAQYGYQYGWIGTYKTANGQVHRIFFGNNYCQY